MAIVHDCKCEARAKAKADLEVFKDACPENRTLVDNMLMQAALDASLRGILRGMEAQRMLDLDKAKVDE